MPDIILKDTTHKKKLKYTPITSCWLVIDFGVAFFVEPCTGYCRIITVWFLDLN